MFTQLPRRRLNFWCWGDAEVIKARGEENVTAEELVEAITPKGRGLFLHLHVLFFICFCFFSISSSWRLLVCLFFEPYSYSYAVFVGSFRSVSMVSLLLCGFGVLALFGMCF